VASQDLPSPPFPHFTEGGNQREAASLPLRRHDRYWLHGLLFGVTLLTTTVVGAAMQIDFTHNMAFDIERTLAPGFWASLFRHPAILFQGLPYSLTLLAVLLAHEFGHYIASTYHRVDASLPYFMPSPLFGTFGAFIRVRSPIYSKRALFDIGVAGPLAGFVFLLPALAVGLAFSKVAPGVAAQGAAHFGTPPLQWILQGLIFPGVSVSDLCFHPVARAAWVGVFATAMNLLPIGQLDGGHILYSFFPRRHRLISRLVCLAMLPLGVFWHGWILWALVLLWLGRRHPVICDDSKLGAGRRGLGWAALAVFILCFTYAPITAGGL
jgi:membrane-associated protease RseP (regulator of RpoE activity)